MTKLTKLDVSNSTRLASSLPPEWSGLSRLQELRVGGPMLKG